jgi:ABC-2 type transport system ATP-binding protein
MKIIELNHLTVSHNQVELLRKLDLGIMAGQITGIIGGPGSGKTTLLQLLSGGRGPVTGRGTVLGIDIYSLQENVHKVPIGYVPASLGLDNELTVSETLQVFSFLCNDNFNREGLVKDILKQVDLASCTEFVVGRLSAKQKLFLAVGISLLPSPQILLIDEPAPYLEAGGRLEFFQLLREIADRGTAVVMATRSVLDGSYCDEAAILYRGKLSIGGSMAMLCKSFDVTCLEAHISGRIDEKLLRILKQSALVTYLSGRTIRIVNPVVGEKELKQYGFYKTQPGLEDVKRLYESVAGSDADTI